MEGGSCIKSSQVFRKSELALYSSIIAFCFAAFSCKQQIKPLSAGGESTGSRVDSVTSVRIDLVDTLEFEALVEVARITKGVNNPKSVIVSPNGLHAYVNNLEGMNTMIINTDTYETEAVIQHTGKPVEFAITGNGRHIWISYFRLLEKGYPKALGIERSYRYPSIVVIYDTLVQDLTDRIQVGIIPKVLVYCLRNKLTKSFEFSKDRIRSSSPGKRF